MGFNVWRFQINIQFRASLMAQMVKNLSAIPETQVRSLGGEDLLEKGMATHSSILAWRIPWTEEPGGLQSRSLTESYTAAVSEHWNSITSTSFINSSES